jgi:hypothetical protein
MSETAFKFEYAISRKIRYFGKRRNFFDALHRLSLFIGSVLGSAAFVSIISNAPTLGAVLAALVAIVSSADNVVGFAERARLYAELRTRYYDLYCDFVVADESTVDLRQFRERRLRIDRDAPPPKKVLDVISRNEEDIGRGFKREETIYISSWRRFLAQLVDLPPRAWQTVAQVEGTVSPPERLSEKSM